MLNERLTCELLGEVAEQETMNPLHVKQPASIHQWMLNEQLARELLGGVPNKRKNESVAREATSLDTPVDAQRAAGTRTAGRST